MLRDPAARIMQAVLLQAVRDVEYGSGAQRREVETWIETEDFVRVCHLAGVDAPAVLARFRGLFACGSRRASTRSLPRRASRRDIAHPSRSRPA